MHVYLLYEHDIDGGGDPQLIEIYLSGHQICEVIERAAVGAYPDYTFDWERDGASFFYGPLESRAVQVIMPPRDVLIGGLLDRMPLKKARKLVERLGLSER